jgi:DNA-binding winged helix-turn-helix (wHTH) protein/tetratricopeptide (TPR) repeat protein
MSPQNFFLNGWFVDVAGGRITQDSQTRHLEPKIMKTLAYLASRPNEVISKDQLVEAVWQRSYVSDAALTRCIFEIRQAFGDNARDPSVIETVPKIGYRMVATPQMSRRLHASGSRPMRWVAAAIIPLLAILSWSTQINSVDASTTYVTERASDNPLANHAYFKGIEHFETGSYLANANAIALFEKAIEHDPSFGLAHVRLSDSLSQQTIHWDGDRLDEARQAAIKGLELAPANAQSHNAYGVVQMLSKQTDSAVESFRRANELDPAHWVSAYNAAKTQMQRFDYADAKVLLLRVLEFQPEHFAAMARLGYVNLRFGDTDEARFWFEKSLEQAPESMMAWTQLAILELVTRNTSKAIENCERVIDIISDHETCLHVIGVGYLMEGDTDEANRIFDYVIEKMHTSDYAQLGLAQIQLSRGDTIEGVEAINAVLNGAMERLPQSDSPWRESRIIAACHTLLGDKSSGLLWLKKSTESGRHFPLWDATDPMFSDLHDDHRFNRFIAMAMDTGPK